MADPLFFAWIDLESTGLDKVNDPIIEVGLVITRAFMPFDEVSCYEAVIRPENSLWKSRMDSYVTRMHTTNGLIADVDDHGRERWEVETEIVELLSQHGQRLNFMLAGSGVSHFDRKFIASQMPRLDEWFQYPSLDVGTIRRALKFSGRKDLDAFGATFHDEGKPHRGLADVRDHLNEFRQYASIFQSIPVEES